MVHGLVGAEVLIEALEVNDLKIYEIHSKNFILYYNQREPSKHWNEVKDLPQYPHQLCMNKLIYE